MFQCCLWLHIHSLQLHFQLQKRKIVERTQIRRGRGMVKSFAWTTRCSRCSAVNTCGTNRAHSFCFFKSSDRMQWTMVFGIPYSLLTSVVLQNSYHPSNVFISFRCSWHSAPLCVFNRQLTRCKSAMPLKYYSARHWRVTKRFYKHFPYFHSCKSRFTTKFYRGMSVKIFFQGNL